MKVSVYYDSLLFFPLLQSRESERQGTETALRLHAHCSPSRMRSSRQPLAAAHRLGVWRWPGGGRGFFQWLCLCESRVPGRGRGRWGRSGSRFAPGGERGGTGGEDPISPPCSRPLGRAPLMGLGKEAAKAALGDCGAAWYPAGSAGGGRGRRDRKRYESAWESKTDRIGDVFL